MEGGNASMYPLLQRDSKQGFFCLVVMAIVPKDGVNIAAKEHVTLRTFRKSIQQPGPPSTEFLLVDVTQGCCIVSQMMTFRDSKMR